jgi:alpha-glucosidase
MNLRQVLLLTLLVLPLFSTAQKLTLASPAGNISITIENKDSIYYSVDAGGGKVILPSSIALLTDHGSFGIRPVVKGKQNRSVNETILNPVPFKRKHVPDHFNELTIRYRENFAVIFRAYNDGIAYRFQTFFNDSLQVEQEIASFRFEPRSEVYYPQVQKRDGLDIFHTSFEEPYRINSLDSITDSQLCFTPVLIDNKRFKTVVTESDLIDYPGMFVKGTSGNSLEGVFAKYPAREVVQGGEFKQVVVLERKNFIAKTAGTRSFPWRVAAIAIKDGDLLMNDLVYRLATPAEAVDWSWIKPGISTEEWINSSNIYQVDFKAGFNTATYKYYIDFASRFGFQFVMLDAGWSDNNDLMKITAGLDLEELSRYAKTKNIELVLWTLAMTLDRQLEDALNMFNKLGVRAIMTDFMDRDDQKTVRFYHRVAKATAAHRIMVMFHGAFKNAGFERTYPNAITREAVLGSEYNMWSDKASPEHDLLIPFIRMVAGPMDYEPGFYRNANQRTFRALPDMVMSQGTRAHQLAMMIAYDSPMQMFSGNPTSGFAEVNYTTYVGSLPTTWDDTRVLDAKLGDYLITARKKDNDWYIAAMTDWTPRDLQVDLSFLAPGKYRAFTCEDGINADKEASDYKLGYELVSPASKLKIKMAAGGGYVVKLIKLNDARP